MKCVLLHELCHMFGAVDLHEPGSIMDIENRGLKFDEFTSKIIALNRQRSFLQDSLPLPDDICEQAIALYEQRANLDLGETDIDMMLASLYMERGQNSLASAACAKLLERNPDMKEIHNYLGNIYLRQGAFEKAIAEYNELIRFYPDSPDVHFNLGLAYSKAGMPDNAEAEYQKAIALNPRYAKAFVYLGHLFLKERRIEQAISMCQAALRLTPDYAEALCVSAAALIHKANFEQYEAGLRKKEKGKTGENVENGSEETAADLFVKAIDKCKRALEIKPGMPEAHNIMGIGYACRGNPKEAEQEFLCALDSDPSFVYAHFNLGILYYSSRQMSKAAYRVTRIMEVNPDSGLVFKILDLIFKRGNAYSIGLDGSDYPGDVLAGQSPKNENR
ncbi:MAG: tetratricopeptide repeat protein [Candidatus Aminicenantes bacterium]|nr:tetratricopeptide repeat protein [Candidatus Aminicenantes bacterium]